MDQPGKFIANPSRGQVNRKNEYSPVPVSAFEFGLAKQVQPSRPAPACSFSVLRLNIMVLTHGIPPNFRGGGVHLFILTAIRHRVTRHRVSPELIGSSCNCVPVAFTAESPPAQGQQVVLTVVPGTGAAILHVTMDQLMCTSLFPHTHYRYEVGIYMLKI